MALHVSGQHASSAAALSAFAQQSLDFALGPRFGERSDAFFQLTPSTDPVGRPQVACTLRLTPTGERPVEVTVTDQDEYRAIERAADLAGLQVGEADPPEAYFDRRSIPFAD